jgi:hypothetical protein
MRPARALCAATCALSFDALAAPADEPPRWHPGNRTTSRVDGQVTTPEAEPVSDGVYGRFEGDLDWGLGVGADVGDSLMGAARLSLHYFSTAGAYVGYADAFGSGSAESAEARRLSVGIDLRPAFVPRWAKDMQQGPGFVDLLVDSISLGLGAFWAEPRDAAFGDSRGFELSLGFGLPLFARAPGLWLEARGLLRWPDGDSAAPAALVLLSWHTLFESPIAAAD